MKLDRLRLRNFRCFRDEITIDFNDITAFVGQNDSGKSTIMEAIDLFLNDYAPDKDDASKDGDAKDLTIICEFSDLPEEVIIDDANPTQLHSEYLLNSDGRLEIHKNYSGNLQKPKCESIDAFAIHPTVDGAKDLLQFKNANLKKHAQNLGIDLSSVDQRYNAPIRKKIRDHLGDLSLAPKKIPLNEENAKKIWTELKKYLPAFALFKSDRVSTDQDPEAQDPLKAAVKEALKAKESDLIAITEYVKEEVQKIAQSTLEKIREMDPSLATQLNPTFAPQKWDSLFKASITSDDDIPINKRGSGVKRLILIFFRAKAEQLAQKTGQTALMYAIEEPETSQHPNNQRMLLRALCDLSSEAQVIISTHTPMLARALPDDCLRYINIREDKTREILVSNPETNKLFARSLGVLPDNTVKLFIGVEGSNDINFLQTIAAALCDDGIDLLDLEEMELKGEVIFFPYGGSNLALWSSRLESLNRSEFHLCDRDNAPPGLPRYQEHVDQVNARGNYCKARSTKKKEIENYLHKDAIIASYEENGITLVIESNFGDFEDVPNEVAKLVHDASDSSKSWIDLTDAQKKEKEKKAKRILCIRAPKYMTSDMLSEIDPDGDLLEWFQDMKDLMAQTE